MIIALFFSIFSLVENIFFLGSSGKVEGVRCGEGEQLETPIPRFWAHFPLGGTVLFYRSLSRRRLWYSSRAFTMVSSIFLAGVPAGKNLEIRSFGILNCSTWLGFSSCIMETMASRARRWPGPFPSDSCRSFRAWAWESYVHFLNQIKQVKLLLFSQVGQFYGRAQSI